MEEGLPFHAVLGNEMRRIPKVNRIFKKGLLQVWRRYIVLLCATLRKLPVHTGRAYRGVNVDWAVSLAMYKPGAVF